MISFEDIIENEDVNSTVLEVTQKITSQLTKMPQWKTIQRFYQQANSTKTICMVSIMNSILTQNRLYFNLSRRTIQTLIKNDPNLERVPTINSREYKKILFALYRNGLIELVEQGAGYRCSAYKTIHPELLKVIKPDEEIQKNAVVQYTRGIK